jgi:hypothetical protein
MLDMKEHAVRARSTWRLAGFFLVLVAAQKEEALPREEIARHDELAEQAIQAAYDKGERPRGFQGQVYLPGDCR